MTTHNEWLEAIYSLDKQDLEADFRKGKGLFKAVCSAFALRGDYKTGTNVRQSWLTVSNKACVDRKFAFKVRDWLLANGWIVQTGTSEANVGIYSLAIPALPVEQKSLFEGSEVLIGEAEVLIGPAEVLLGGPNTTYNTTKETTINTTKDSANATSSSGQETKEDSLSPFATYEPDSFDVNEGPALNDTKEPAEVLIGHACSEEVSAEAIWEEAERRGIDLNGREHKSVLQYMTDPMWNMLPGKPETRRVLTIDEALAKIESNREDAW